MSNNRNSISTLQNYRFSPYILLSQSSYIPKKKKSSSKAANYFENTVFFSSSESIRRRGCNSFFLYMKDKTAEFKGTPITSRQRFTKLVANMWKEESVEVRLAYEKKAKMKL